MDRRRGSNNRNNGPPQRGGGGNFRNPAESDVVNGDAFGNNSPGQPIRRDVHGQPKPNGNKFWQPRNPNDQRNSPNMFTNSMPNNAPNHVHHKFQSRPKVVSSHPNGSSGGNINHNGAAPHFSNHKNPNHQSRHGHQNHTFRPTGPQNKSDGSNFRFHKNTNNGNGNDMGPKRTTSNGSRFKTGSFSGRPFQKGGSRPNSFRHQYQKQAPSSDQSQFFPIYDDSVPDDESLAENRSYDTQTHSHPNEGSIEQASSNNLGNEPSHNGFDAASQSTEVAPGKLEITSNKVENYSTYEEHIKPPPKRAASSPPVSEPLSQEDVEEGDVEPFQIPTRTKSPDSLGHKIKEEPIIQPPLPLEEPEQVLPDVKRPVSSTQPIEESAASATPPHTFEQAESDSQEDTNESQGNKTTFREEKSEERPMTAEEIEELMNDNYSNESSGSSDINDDSDDGLSANISRADKNDSNQPEEPIKSSYDTGNDKIFLSSKLHPEDTEDFIGLPNSSPLSPVSPLSPESIESPLAPPTLEPDDEQEPSMSNDNPDLPPLEPPATPPDTGISGEPEVYMSSPITQMPKKRSKRGKKLRQEINYQIFNDLPSKTEEAEQSFEVLLESTYSHKSLGSSGQYEAMTCDCREHWEDGKNMACNDDSACINRLTSIECVNWKCFCGKDCRNQRFQKREYAKVDVILTEKKGYGLRALEYIPHGSFVYEYVGEVISEVGFRKRAKEYRVGGNTHFYFMMLQKGEFIDATSRGGLARFCNHSCNPNCYVDKWVVGDKLRMGIFTKRDILQGEEITFDYNVDRYGADAQPCYCGEPNCVGVLGGKTQTEVVNKLPQVLLDALDMDDQDEDTWIANNVKRKKIKSDEDLDEDFEVDDDDDYSASLPTKPISMSSVSKIMSGLMQSREEWLIRKLINRISNTDDKKIHLQVMNMHGYQIFNNLLRDWKAKVTDLTVIKKVLEIMTKWPRLTRNKISSSKIEGTVEEIVKECEEQEIVELAKSLLTEWSSLQMAYRIPRRERKAVSEESGDDEKEGDTKTAESTEEVDTSGWPVKRDEPEPDQTSQTSNDYGSKSNLGYYSSQPPFKKYKRNEAPNQDRFADLRLPEGPRKIVMAQQAQAQARAAAAAQSLENGLPSGWRSANAPSGRTYYYNRSLGITQWERPSFQPPKGPHGAANDGGYFGHKPSITGYEDRRQNEISVADTEKSRKEAQERMLEKIIAQALEPTKSSTTTSSIQSQFAQNSQHSSQTRLAGQFRNTDSRHMSADPTTFGFGDQSLSGTPDISVTHGTGLMMSSSSAYNSDEAGRSVSPHIPFGSKSSPGPSPGLSPSFDGFSEAQVRTLQKSLAKVVPNMVVKFKGEIGHDKVKQYSREIVHILVEKELRGKPTKIDPELSTEKRMKIKVFVKSYMSKVLQKLKSRQEPVQPEKTPIVYEDTDRRIDSQEQADRFINGIFDQERLSTTTKASPFSISNGITPSSSPSVGELLLRPTSALNSVESTPPLNPTNSNTIPGLRGAIPSAPAGFNKEPSFGYSRPKSFSGSNDNMKFGFKGQSADRFGGPKHKRRFSGHYNLLRENNNEGPENQAGISGAIATPTGPSLDFNFRSQYASSKNTPAVDPRPKGPSGSSTSSASTNSWSNQQKLVMMAPPQYGDDYAGGDDCNEQAVGMAALNNLNTNANSTEIHETPYNQEAEGVFDEEGYDEEENDEGIEEDSGDNTRISSNRGGRGRGGFFRRGRGSRPNNPGRNNRFSNGHGGNKFMYGHGVNKGKFGGSRGKFRGRGSSNW